MTTTRKLDPEVEQIFNTIREIKETWPGLRVGQIIGNVADDPYYHSDKDLLSALQRYQSEQEGRSPSDD